MDFRKFCAVALASCLVCVLNACDLAGANAADSVEDYRAVPRVQAAASQQNQLESAHFERSFMLVARSRATFIDRVSLLQQTDWPTSFSSRRRQAQQRGITALSPELGFEDFNNVTIQSRWAELDGRQYFFVSAAAPQAARPIGGVAKPPPNSIHTLVYIPDQGDSPQTVVLQNISADRYGHTLQYDLAKVNGALVLVYAAADGIYQSIGRKSGDKLAFSEPRRIHSEGSGAHGLQLRTSGKATHLLWAASNGRGFDAALHYMRSADPQTGWDDPKVISSTASYLTPTLLVEKDDVYICWCDHRFRTGTWSPVNSAKAFLTKSTDGGASFSDTVLLNDRSNQSDVPSQMLLIPGERNLILLWRNETQPTSRGNWDIGTLDRQMKTLTVGGTVTAEELRRAYVNRLQSIVRSAAARSSARVP